MTRTRFRSRLPGRGGGGLSRQPQGQANPTGALHRTGRNAGRPLGIRRVPAVIRRVRESDHSPGYGGKRAATVSPQIGRPMKKKLPPAKLPLPKFQSNQDAAEYLESHSVASVWEQLPEVTRVKLSPALAGKIRDRHARAKSPISLRLVPEQFAGAADTSLDRRRGQPAAMGSHSPDHGRRSHSQRE